MTDIYCNKDEDLYTIIALDHADAGTACAGISAILQALEGWCNNNTVTHHKSHLEPGNVMIQFKGDEKAGAAFEMAVIGLMQIEKGYLGTCRVTYEESMG